MKPLVLYTCSLCRIWKIVLMEIAFLGLCSILNSVSIVIGKSPSIKREKMLDPIAFDLPSLRELDGHSVGVHQALSATLGLWELQTASDCIMLRMYSLCGRSVIANRMVSTDPSVAHCSSNYGSLKCADRTSF